jgi:aminoglycoside-2''-adenylyltransferase
MSQFHGPAIGHWSPLQPQEVATLLAGVNRPWWIAGGWALDLFLGFQTRAHDDLDVGVLRRNVLEVTAHLCGWEFFEARSQALYRLAVGEAPRAEVNSMWCRRCGEQRWSFELLLDDAHADAWVFRRWPALQIPLDKVIRRTPNGIPFLTPEIQLLYKARHPRTKDQSDFERLLPRLGSSERTWLCDALSRIDSEHAWLTTLRSWPSATV